MSRLSEMEGVPPDTSDTSTAETKKKTGRKSEWMNSCVECNASGWAGKDLLLTLILFNLKQVEKFGW